jgi:hypothetical protein
MKRRMPGSPGRGRALGHGKLATFDRKLVVDAVRRGSKCLKLI